ncbi:hypothetical protein D3C87_1322460 [compost metagenome]
MNHLSKVIVFYFLFLQLQVGYSQVNSQLFNPQKALGEIIDKQLSELSGVINATQSSYFWVHNDSGDDARVYLINKKGKLMCSYQLESIDVKDCEDIARVMIKGKSFLILADIGDNRAHRKHVKLHIFPEPVYKDGPRDAEALFVDPIDRQLYIVSKRDFQSTVYKSNVFNDSKKNLSILTPVQKLPFTFVTSADISPSGDAVLIKNLTQIFYWKRKRSESIEETLSKKPISIPYEVESQGEAIAFGLEGEGFYTVSERPFGLKSYLYFFEKR